MQSPLGQGHIIDIAGLACDVQGRAVMGKRGSDGHARTCWTETG